MAIDWGAWASGSTSNQFRVGIDLSVSGTTITAKFYIEALYAIDDNVVLTRSGASTGTSTHAVDLPSGGTQLLKTVTRTGSKGVSYSFTGKITDIYNGATPQNTDSITVPVTVPTAPGTPAASNVSGTGFKATWSDPSDWGGNNTSSFDLDISTSSSFSSYDRSAQGNNDHTYSGLTPGETYYVRVRAKNSAGVGPWSSTRTVTLYDYPDAPVLSEATEVTAVSARLQWTAPDNGGQTITDYQAQIATDAGFASVVLDVTGETDRDYTPNTLTPGVTYYARSRAINSVGWGDWSNVVTFETLAGVKVFDGAAWQDRVPKVWDGAAWQEVPPQVWDGDSFEVPAL